MREYEADRQKRLKYEKTLYRYSTALERGDLDTIIAILYDAENDPYLEHLIFEMHQEGYQKEEPIMNHDSTRSAHPTGETAEAYAPVSGQGLRSQPKQRRPARRGWLTAFQGVAAAVFVALLVGSALLIFSVVKTSHTTGTRPSSVGAASQTATSHDIVAVAEIAPTSYTSGTGSITASDAHTGAKLWSYTLPEKISLNTWANLAIQDQVVYFASNRQILALNAQNGSLLWRTPLGTRDQNVIIGDPLPSLVVEQGRVYASGYSDGNLYTLDAKTGKIIWSYTAIQPALLSVSKGIAYVIADEHAIKALDGKDGHVLWTQDVETAPISATTADGVFYVQVEHSLVGDPDGSHKDEKPLVALDATTGKKLWSVVSKADAPTDLVVEQGILVLFDGSHFCGYRTSDGASAWCTSGPQNLYNGVNIRSLHGTIYGIFNGDSAQTVQALNPQDGKVYWSKEVIHASGTNGSLLILPFDKSLILPFQGVVLNQANGEELWHLQNTEMVITGAVGR
ncbi:MAG TPA: PQQ-binding-like beta-propeller repeat protein [Ktedonobacteraceae bacterium]|nr:PQQ-binding-like beta-propeller repeat protein [Ktedonobacteraceae bacterium]